MKHGKRHRAEVVRSLPEWERKFLSYKALKRKLKVIHMARSGTGDMGFKQSLNREMEKVNTFYLDKEEYYIIMIKLESRAKDLNGTEEMLELKRQVLGFYSEMVMILHYSVINFTWLMKIVKKHAKRACGVVYSPHMHRVFQQSFFSTELLYNLIRGCEAILEHFSPPE